MADWYESDPVVAAAPQAAPSGGNWYDADPVAPSVADAKRIAATVASDAPAAGISGDASAAVGRGLIEGIPILGAPAMGILNKGIAGLRALKNDTRYSDELKNVEQFGERTAAEHPYASTAGEISGGIIGTAPLMAAAPAAFGMGTGGLAARTAASAASGAALGGADAAVRSGGDLSQIKTGAELGGALGAAGPLVGAGIGKAYNMATGGAPGANMLHEGVRGLTEADLAAAQAAREAAAAQGVPLSVGEAVNAATGGRAGRLSQIERVAANSGGEGGQIAGDFYAARPGQVTAAGGRAFQELTPQGMATPTDLGFDLQAAAARGVAQTPEGQALQAARDAAGPRVSPEQAGQAIQGDLRARADALEAARSQQAATDYAAARAAPEAVGMEGPNLTVERPDGIYPGGVVLEQIPTVRSGQVDPRPAIAAVAEQGQTAKGDVRGALAAAGRDLLEPAGQPDMSVQGLLHARERLDFAIQSAQEAGDRTKVRDLAISRDALDRQLKAVPEVSAADANFAANSRPLEPFTGNGPLAQVTRREGNAPGGRLTAPAEQVPGILSGPTAAREAVANGTGATREALAGRVQTQILDSAARNGDVSAEALRSGILQHEDVLRQFPEVRGRLEAIATRRDAMARIESSPLGRIADKPEVANAINALFPESSGLNHSVEAGRAMAALVRNDPRSAEQLARTHLETMFNDLTQGRRGLESQYGGAAFGSAILDHAERAKTIEAVMRALSNGDARWTAFRNLMETLKATGYRPQKGSDTAFNQAIQKEMASGKTPFGEALSNALAGGAVGMLAGGPKGGAAGLWLGAKHGLSDAMARAQMARQGAAIARLMYDPAALPDLRALAKSPTGSRNAEVFTARLIARASSGLEAPLRQPTLH